MVIAPSSVDTNLSQLLLEASIGKIQLPEFQRDWTWDDDRIRGILASLSQGYPMGAIMRLQYGNPDIKFRYRTLEGVGTVNETPEYLILDGQQRLTSMYQAVFDDQPVRTITDKKAKIQRYYYLDMKKCLDDNEDRIIYVPMAHREQKPVFINDDLFGGTFRRNHEGDYHCTRLQVKSMLRDQTEATIDMEVLDDVPMLDLNYESIHGYRNRHRSLKAGHPFERLEDEEYLRSIGAAAISDVDKQLHPTAAGMLMFGDEYNIVRHFPEYFLDYREMLDPAIRWTDRLYSSSGEWSGNLHDFYFRVYNKIIKDVKVPFKIREGTRIDDTPVHEAIREALANCLINADYYGVRGVVIKKDQNTLVLENPGYVRTGKKQMRLGGVSDPRNKALMKMFNLINIGERAGSGVPNIFNIWDDEGYEEPVIEEQFDPDRTILSLAFIKKQAKKTSEENKRRKTSEENKRRKTSEEKQAKKTIKHMESIRSYLAEHKEAKTKEIAEYLGLSPARTRAIIGLVDDIEGIGNTSNRRYHLKDNSKA